MDSKNKYSERIAAYLFDDMTQEERVQFDNDLLIDEDLADEFEIQSNAISYIESRVILEDMKSDPYLSDAELLVDKYFESNKVKTKIITFNQNRRIYWVGAVAAVLVGLISAVSILIQDPIVSLFTRYYSPIDEATISSRGDNGDLGTEISNAVQLYFNEDYIESTEIFKHLNGETPNNPIINLYIGLNSLALEEFEEAINQFEDYIDSYELFLPEVKWYLSLCYLKIGNAEKARILLNELENYPGKLGDDSKSLNKKLKRRLIK